MRRVVVVVILTAVWVGLWGEASPANLISGAVVAVMALVAVPLDPPTGRGTIRVLPALSYAAFFTRALVAANVQVAWEVVTPRNRDNEGIVAVPAAPSCSRTVLMILVNCIGLTPGTVVVEIGEDPRVLYVHVLHLDDAEASRRALLDLQLRAMRAFGSDAALAEAEALVALSSTGATPVERPR